MRATTLLMLASMAAAQNFSVSVPASTTISGSAYQNPTLFATALNVNVDDLWNLLVGPVTSAYYTTTVSPTPVPSSSLVPPPPLYYSPFPTGAQVPYEAKNESWSFPKDFFWGVAGAAFQIEGAVEADGRGPTDWDALTHRVTDWVVNNYTADVSTNNYYMYKEDFARLQAMGVKAYSVTISWSRIMPFGRGPVNQAGIDHYNDVINSCIEYGMLPIVTLYHWDTPLYLQDTYGAWLSEEIVDDFVEYARVVFAAYGDRVKHWFTVNEPIVYCGYYPTPSNYFKNFSIPAAHQPYYCGQNTILAHSQVYRLGKSMMPDAMIAYKNNGGYKVPLTNSSDDALAVQRAWDFNEGWFSDPIYLTGDYNAAVKAYVSGFLRPFTAQEQATIKGSADFYAHDAYTAQFYFAPEGGVAACINNSSNSLYPSCANTSYTYSAADGGWLIGPASDPLASWLHKATDWLPAFMRYIKTTWADPAGDLPIVISEFGFAEPFELYKTLLADILYDPVRMSYYHDYTRGILMALAEGVNIIGCVAWSFVDNFEWADGFAVKFGMQYVNYSDPTLPRYYKASFFEYKSAFDMYQEQ